VTLLTSDQFVFDILQIPGGCSHICSGCSVTKLPPPPATGLRLLLFQVKFEIFGVVCAGVSDSKLALSDEHLGLITEKKNPPHYSLRAYEFWRNGGCVLLAPVLMLVPSTIQVMILKMMRRAWHVASLW